MKEFKIMLFVTTIVVIFFVSITEIYADTITYEFTAEGLYNFVFQESNYEEDTTITITKEYSHVISGTFSYDPDAYHPINSLIPYNTLLEFNVAYNIPIDYLDCGEGKMPYITEELVQHYIDFRVDLYFPDEELYDYCTASDNLMLMEGLEVFTILGEFDHSDIGGASYLLKLYTNESSELFTDGPPTSVIELSDLENTQFSFVYYHPFGFQSDGGGEVVFSTEFTGTLTGLHRVPEPNSLTLFGLVLFGLLLQKKKEKRGFDD